MGKSERYDLTTTNLIRKNVIRMICEERKRKGKKNYNVKVEDEFAFLGLSDRTYQRYRKGGFIVQELENIAIGKKIDVAEFFLDEKGNYIEPTTIVETQEIALLAENIESANDPFFTIKSVSLAVVYGLINWIGFMNIESFGYFLLFLTWFIIAFIMSFFSVKLQLKKCNMILTGYMVLCAYVLINGFLEYEQVTIFI